MPWDALQIIAYTLLTVYILVAFSIYEAGLASSDSQKQSIKDGLSWPVTTAILLKDLFFRVKKAVKR